MCLELDFYTSHCQFYITDKIEQGDVSSDKFWTKEAYVARLAMDTGIIGIRTGSYGHIRCKLKILEGSSEIINTAIYEHIVEGGLSIISGKLEVQSCPDSKIILMQNVIPGKYRVRVSSSNLSLADIDEDDGPDRYMIEIWPDTNLERKVLKQYTPPYEN